MPASSPSTPAPPAHLTGDDPPAKPALSPEQIQRIADLKAFAAKRQKVVRLLIEAEPHQKASEKVLAAAQVLENHQSEPDE